jgi:hypothetical protein
MAMDRLFFGYMALIGAAAGAILVAAPGSQDLFIKPYFWVLSRSACSTAGSTCSAATPRGRS